MAKQLLVEYIPLTYNALLIKEAVEGGKPVRIKALLQRANSKNQNGRMYPKEILLRESEKYSHEFVGERRALGELDHPEERTVVNLATVSHVITEMHWEGDDLIGTLEVLTTPSGNIVKELIRGGIRLGISSRGVGSVRQIGEGSVQVEDDFSLICFDIVSNPSTQGAYLGESVQIGDSTEVVRSKRINSLINDFFEARLGN